MLNVVKWLWRLGDICVRHGDDFDWPGGHSANQDAHVVLPSIQTALIH